MLYELIAVVRPGSLIEVKDIARSTGSSILKSGGVIRGITNWGNFSLPRRIYKHQAQHQSGHYFVMQFDTNSATQEAIRKTLTLDPRMIRFSVVKMGNTLDAIKDIDGRVPWSDNSLSTMDVVSSRY